MVKQENIMDLIYQARDMLLDRSEYEQDLIYSIATLDSNSRCAISLAYKLIRESKND